jgi:hypothetical protein
MSPISFGLKGDVPKDWDWNFPQFNHFAEIYRQAGHTVVNPADNGADAKPNEEYYRLAVKQLADCDHIVMLPGWESSKGANLELYIAQALGMEITYLEAS